MNPAAPTAWELAEGVLRRWWVLLLGFLLGGLLAAGATLALPGGYVASTAVVVQLPAQDSADTEAMIRTVQSLTLSDVLMRDIASKSRSGLSGPDVARRITVERAAGSAVIDISVRDEDKERAVTIADTVLPSLESRLGRARIADRAKDGVRSSRAIQVQALGLATVQPVTAPVARNGVLGAVGGLGAFLLVAVLMTVASAQRAQRRVEDR